RHAAVAGVLHPVAEDPGAGRCAVLQLDATAAGAAFVVDVVLLDGHITLDAIPDHEPTAAEGMNFVVGDRDIGNVAGSVHVHGVFAAGVDQVVVQGQAIRAIPGVNAATGEVPDLQSADRGSG